MKLSLHSGTTIAAAAAVLIISGALAPAAQAAEGAKGHCVGANACKGKSACKTAANDCAGKNDCKGKGFLAMTKEECDAVEGATFEPAS